MKRRVVGVAAILLIVAGLFIIARLAASTLAPRGRGALQVTSNIKAKVTLDGKDIGSTPLCLCEQNQTIGAGVYDLKITPDDKTLNPFGVKVNVNNGVLTAVERTFLPGGLASAYILTLEKTNSADPQIFISSIPDNALVNVDGESKDVTPYAQTLSASEHEIEMVKVGFTKKTVRVRAVKNYKLVLNVILGAEGVTDESVQTTVTPPTPESQTPSVTPQKTVVIGNTPTGFLRVRASPSISAQEIGRVSPGEKYEYIDENESWLEIKLSNGTSGWVSKSYSQILSR